VTARDGNALFELIPTGLAFRVSLTPKAGSNRIDGVLQGPEGQVLKVRITAVPEKGKANKALIKLLAKETGIASGRFDVISGTTSRKKRLLVQDGGKSMLSALDEWSKTLSSVT
jgi:hypothetical protein